MAAVTEPAIAAIGGRVRALREAQRLSLRDLADRSGVSAPMLSQVERGETSPTLQVAARIAAGLELRLSQLLRLDEEGAVTVVRSGERRKGPLAKSWDELGVIYDELKNTEATYTNQLRRFARDQAPRLDQMRERLKSVGRRIGTTIAAPASGATQP